VTPLTSLSPARRRLVFGLLVLGVAAGIAVALIGLLRGKSEVRPVAQDEPGPVLLVPGYGGSAASLQVLTDALTTSGRDAHIVRPRGAGTQDLRDQAKDLSSAVEDALARTGAPSVDLVGYSAGGVVVRYYVAELGGGSTVRRAITLASPHHGTDLAALAGSLGAEACPEACRQLDPDSDLLRRLNASDESPEGPVWVALWTEDDQTVVPPESGSLGGALAYSMQSVCPGLTVAHPDVPRTPQVIAMVQEALDRSLPALPSDKVCRFR
jgi:triacylglycerol lipase